MNNVFALIAIVGIVAAALALSGFLFMFLWNLVMPVIFGLPAIDFITGLAASLLVGIIGSAFRK
jgi:hypothetical protein